MLASAAPVPIIYIEILNNNDIVVTAVTYFTLVFKHSILILGSYVLCQHFAICFSFLIILFAKLAHPYIRMIHHIILHISF